MVMLKKFLGVGSFEITIGHLVCRQVILFVFHGGLTFFK
jgi:hypothetical protein